MPRVIVKYEKKETVYDRAEDVTTIGRNEGNHLVLLDPTASQTHCRIEKMREGFVLLDLGGKNGTRVNGVRIVRHTLKAGDTIEIGATTLVFRGDASKPGAPAPEEKRLLITGQEERFILDVATGREAGRRHVLKQERTTIGRDAECDLALKDQTASRTHACLICTPTEFLIEDQQTRNGTLVNGQKISRRCPLKHGDEIRVGNTRIVFRDLQSLAHRVETVAMTVSREPEPGLAPMEESAVADGRDFMRRIAERQRARRRVRALIAVIALLVACGAGGYYVWQYGVFAPKAGFVAVNLLKENPSFEAGLVDKLPKGWSFGKEGASRWRAAARTGGGTCLDLEGTTASDPEGSAEAVCDEKVKVADKKHYQVSVKTMTEGSKGTALLKVTWLTESGQAVLESYSQPSWGAHDWQWLTAVFLPPDGASALQVSCVGAGNSRRIFFDELTVYEGPVGEGSPGALRADVPENNCKVCLDDKGLFSVLAGPKAVMSNGEGRVEGQPAILMRQAFASIDPGYPQAAAPGWYTFSTRLVDTSTMTLVNLRQSTNTIREPGAAKDAFWVITYTIIGDPTQPRPTKWVGTSFFLPSDVVEAGMVIGSGLDTLTKTGEFKQADVDSLILGKGEGRLVVDLANPHQIPFNLECKRQGSGYLATASVPMDVIQPQQRVEWSVTFGKQCSARAKAIIQRARQTAAVDRDHVAALKIYQKVTESDLFPDSDKQVARDEVKLIEEFIEKKIAPVKDEVDKALRAADQDDLKVAEIDVKELYDKYGATRFGPKIAGLRQQIEDFRAGKVVKAEGDVVELLKKAKSNFEKEGWMVAKVFAENVIRKGGPNTAEAKEAQKLLDAIPQAREDAKARDEFVNKRLATAATYEKNNMPAKAVPIYEEILKKYPKSKWTPDITKRLEEAKKKAGGK